MTHENTSDGTDLSSVRPSDSFRNDQLSNNKTVRIFKTRACWGTESVEVPVHGVKLIETRKYKRGLQALNVTTVEHAGEHWFTLPKRLRDAGIEPPQTI